MDSSNRNYEAVLFVQGQVRVWIFSIIVVARRVVKRPAGVGIGEGRIPALARDLDVKHVLYAS